MRRSAKIKANNRRRSSKRVWNYLVKKRSNKSTVSEQQPIIFFEEDAEDRFERHMKPIREAQKNNAQRK